MTDRKSTTRRMLAMACAAVLSAPAAALAQDQVAPAAALPNPMMMAPNPMNPSMARPLGVAPQAGQPDIERDPDFGNLPVGAGLEDTFYACTACHSEQTFATQRLTDARWNYLWDWMIVEQGMPDYEAETKEIILGYLTSHFSSER